MVHLACEAHVRAVLLEAVEGVMLTPWVERLAEDLQTPPVLVYWRIASSGTDSPASWYRGSGEVVPAPGGAREPVPSLGYSQ